VSGTEFERMAGKGAAKKWKMSIRLLQVGGGGGRGTRHLRVVQVLHMIVLVEVQLGSN
jgi:hypothetical protein